MIHVAPCSCELHVRIRELEAELAARNFQLEEVLSSKSVVPDKTRHTTARERDEREREAD